MIKAVITDFDGTLVDTFEANLRSYQRAFEECGLVLKPDTYRACFGLRYDAFMSQVGVLDSEVATQIRELKKKYYPEYFEYLSLNNVLLETIDTFHRSGVRTAIASTANKDNLMNVVHYYDLGGFFDYILAGIDVIKGKPDPEIYVKAMGLLGVKPDETLVFEDSEIGIKAAKASNARCIHVTEEWFLRC